MKKLLKYLAVFLVTALSLTFTSCSDKDKDRTEPKPEEVQLYGGTWKCIPTADQKNSEYPYSICFNKNGTLTGKWLEGDGDMSSFTGSWELSGPILNIIAIFRNDAEDDIEAEEWTCKVVTITNSELVINWEGEKFTFVR